MTPKIRHSTRHRISVVLVFLLATLGATSLQFVALSVLPEGSPLLLALPLAGGALFTAFMLLLIRKQCARCPLPERNDHLEHARNDRHEEILRLRRQAAEAERQTLALQRQIAECTPGDYSERRIESRFQAAFHATPDPILFINAATGLVVEVNESFLRLLRMSWREVLGAPVQTILHWRTPEDAKRFRNVHATGTASNLRAGISAGNGTHREFLISVRRMDLEGVRCDIIIARDITDMELLRSELADKTELLESILRHIPYYIYWKNPRHRYAGANDLFRRALLGDRTLPLEGLTDDEIPISPFAGDVAGTPPNAMAGAMAGAMDGTQSRAEDARVLETGQPVIHEERAMWLGGRLADVLVSKVPLRDKAGSISGLLGIMADISDLRRSERQFAMLLNGIPDPAWIKDAEGRYIVANRALSELTGVPAADIPGRTDADILPPDMARRCMANERAVVQQGVPLRNDEPCEIAGRTAWYEVIRQPLTETDADGTVRVTGTMGIARDISQRRKAEDEIRTLSRALEQSSAAVAITSREGDIEYVNPRYTEITGYLPAEATGRPPHFLRSLPDMEPQEIWQRIHCGDQWRGEVRTTRKGGEQCWIFASVSPLMDDAGTILQALVVLDDITGKKEQEEYIRFMAMHDGLTSLPNRRLFMSQLRHAVAVHQRDATPFALLFIDLNDFKKINDTHGHDAGDTVLRTVARRLVDSLREVDTAARLGGDEFVVLLHGVSGREEVRTASHRIAEAICRPVRIGAEPCVVTPAIGVAMCPQHGTDPDELLSLADKAMYLCKNERNCPYVECGIQPEG
ncbi:GGDEF domain-containing protein [Desulfovibrio psychrotolerans]|nr:GGDEF domain-containing protein [Desulfovibrio psychrotolerans]